MFSGGVGHVRLVCEQDRRLTRRHGFSGAGEIGATYQRIVGAADPKPMTVPFDGPGFVQKHGKTCGLQGAGHPVGRDVMVMVAQNSEGAHAAMEIGERACAGLGIHCRARSLRQGHEVSGQDH